MVDREQVVNDLKTVASCRVVNAGDIRNLGELRSCVVLEKFEHGDDGRRRDIDRQLVFPDGELLDVPWETRDKVSPVSM